MKGEKFENVDISSAIAYLMAPKEDSEIITVKKACLVTVDVFTKYLKDQIMEIIDSDKVSFIEFFFQNSSFTLMYIYTYLMYYF